MLGTTILLAMAAFAQAPDPAPATPPPPAPAAAPPPAAPRDCTPAPADCIAGSWTGAFADATWTFEFAQADGRWTARYQTDRANRWHAMPRVAVSGSTVSADIESTPTLTFVLSPDAGGATMSGEVRVGERRLTAFTATRRP